jgi:hypothetical protein
MKHLPTHIATAAIALGAGVAATYMTHNLWIGCGIGAALGLEAVFVNRNQRR